MPPGTTLYYNCARHTPPDVKDVGKHRHGAVRNLGYCPARCIITIGDGSRVNVRILNLHSHMCDPFRSPLPSHVRAYIRSRLRVKDVDVRQILLDVREWFDGLSKILSISHVTAESTSYRVAITKQRLLHSPYAYRVVTRPSTHFPLCQVQDGG